MAKSKTKRGEREYDMLDRMKYENEKLKKEVSALRKQVKSLRKMVTKSDIGRHQDFQEFIQYKRQERKIEKSKQASKQPHKRQCYDCGKGRLEMKTMKRRDGLFYWRACNLCGKTTLMKPWKEGVEE